MHEDGGARALAVLGAVVLAVAFVLLGLAVSPYPPHGLDLLAGGIVGQATPLAAFLTGIGRFTGYAPLCVALLVAGFVRRPWLGRVTVSIALLLLAWATSDALKAVFRRPRPEHWLVTHETTYAYASGHACNAIVFFGFWTVIALRSSLPVAARVTLSAALMGLAGGIGWSRLALGAHYPTDVVGGYLLGACVLTVGLLVVPAWVLALPRQKSRLAAAWAPLRRS